MGSEEDLIGPISVIWSWIIVSIITIFQEYGGVSLIRSLESHHNKGIAAGKRKLYHTLELLGRFIASLWIVSWKEGIIVGIQRGTTASPTNIGTILTEISINSDWDLERVTRDSHELYKGMVRSSSKTMLLNSILRLNIFAPFYTVLKMTQSQLIGTSGDHKKEEGTRKRLKISVPHFDNSEIIKGYSRTVVGRCLNPGVQDTKALVMNFPKIWKLED